VVLDQPVKLSLGRWSLPDARESIGQPRDLTCGDNDAIGRRIVRVADHAEQQE
jgi:hypothetical protein